MTVLQRFPALVAGLALLAGGCTWKTASLDTTTPAALAESSRIFAADGSFVTALHGEENRETVSLDRKSVV